MRTRVFRGAQNVAFRPRRKIVKNADARFPLETGRTDGRDEFHSDSTLVTNTTAARDSFSGRKSTARTTLVSVTSSPTTYGSRARGRPETVRNVCTHTAWEKRSRILRTRYSRTVRRRIRCAFLFLYVFVLYPWFFFFYKSQPGFRENT